MSCKDDLLGKCHSILKSGFHDNAFYHEMWAKFLNGKYGLVTLETKPRMALFLGEGNYNSNNKF